MKINAKTTISLTPNDLRSIVTEYFTQKGYSVKSVSFEVGTECRGYGLGEHEETVFEGCSVECAFLGKNKEDKI